MKRKKKLDYSNLSDEDYEKELKRYLVPALRRISMEWPPRSEAKKLARVERGKYKCASCKMLFHGDDIQMDHIESVVGLDGYKNIETYLRRMLPKRQGWQALCVTCHDLKTEEDRILRTLNRQSKKKSNKKNK